MCINVRLHTTVYNILRHNVQQYTTMLNNVRQKWLPYDNIFVAPKSFTSKTFKKKIAALLTKTLDSPRTTERTNRNLHCFNSHLVAPSNSYVGDLSITTTFIFQFVALPTKTYDSLRRTAARTHEKIGCLNSHLVAPYKWYVGDQHFAAFPHTTFKVRQLVQTQISQFFDEPTTTHEKMGCLNSHLVAP